MDTYKKRSAIALCTALTISLSGVISPGLMAQDYSISETIIMANTTPNTISDLVLGLNTVWMLLAAMLVFFMQPGLFIF